MLFKYDKVPYKTKATGMEIGKIQNRIKIADQEEISIDKLVKIIERGSSFYLCQFKEENSVSISNVIGTSMLALDIDGKDQVTQLPDAIELVKKNFNVTPVISYYTFNSTKDFPRYRLIYQLDRFVDVTEFKKLYNSLILALNKDHEVIDSQASNCNRLWSGTNKGVTVYDNAIPFNVDKIISRLPKTSEKKKTVLKIDDNKNNYIYKDYYIKKQYRSMIRQQLIEEISVQDYLESHFGARIKNRRCNCVVHGGDNKSALAIYDKSCYCFTRCGHMSVVDLAKNYLGISDDNEVTLRLLKEYNITFNLNAIGRRR